MEISSFESTAFLKQQVELRRYRSKRRFLISGFLSLLTIIMFCPSDASWWFSDPFDFMSLRYIVLLIVVCCCVFTPGLIKWGHLLSRPFGLLSGRVKAVGEGLSRAQPVASERLRKDIPSLSYRDRLRSLESLLGIKQASPSLTDVSSNPVLEFRKTLKKACDAWIPYVEGFACESFAEIVQAISSSDSTMSGIFNLRGYKFSVARGIESPSGARRKGQIEPDAEKTISIEDRFLPHDLSMVAGLYAMWEARRRQESLLSLEASTDTDVLSSKALSVKFLDTGSRRAVLSRLTTWASRGSGGLGMLGSPIRSSFSLILEGRNNRTAGPSREVTVPNASALSDRPEPTDQRILCMVLLRHIASSCPVFSDYVDFVDDSQLESLSESAGSEGRSDWASAGRPNKTNNGRDNSSEPSHRSLTQSAVCSGSNSYNSVDYLGTAARKKKGSDSNRPEIRKRHAWLRVGRESCRMEVCARNFPEPFGGGEGASNVLGCLAVFFAIVRTVSFETFAKFPQTIQKFVDRMVKEKPLASSVTGSVFGADDSLDILSDPSRFDKYDFRAASNVRAASDVRGASDVRLASENRTFRY